MRSKKRQQHLDHFRINCRRVGCSQLNSAPTSVELSVAPFLRPFAPKHRPHVVELFVLPDCRTCIPCWIYARTTDAVASGRNVKLFPNSILSRRFDTIATSLDQLSPENSPKRASLSSSERVFASAEMACKLTGVRGNSSFCVAICKQLRKSSRFRRNEGARSGRNGSPMITARKATKRF